MQQESKVFAFKLAQQQEEKQQEQQWQVREDVALAGCSGEDARGPGRWTRDSGVYC